MSRELKMSDKFIALPDTSAGAVLRRLKHTIRLTYYKIQSDKVGDPTKGKRPRKEAWAHQITIGGGAWQDLGGPTEMQTFAYNAEKQQIKIVPLVDPSKSTDKRKRLVKTLSWPELAVMRLGNYKRIGDGIYEYDPSDMPDLTGEANRARLLKDE